MFCTKCGKEIPDGTVFCPGCGNKIGEAASSAEQKVKVMLDPADAMPQKETADSSRSLSGQGKTIGFMLMIISIIGDLLAMVTIGFDAFIPITIGAMVLFVVGFLLRLFCP